MKSEAFSKCSEYLTKAVFPEWAYCFEIELQETVTVGVDGTVLERIAKIMAYLRLGSSGKVV